MARVDVIMPQMGESIAEGTLSKWLKKAGEDVKRDEPIFEISTDKVDAEIPAPVAGVLAEILVTEGQTVPVQTVVARLETDRAAFAADGEAGKGGAGSDAAQGPPPSATAPSVSLPSSAPVPGSPPHPLPPPSGDGASFEERIRTRSSPLVRKIAAEHGIEVAAMQGTGVAGRVTKRDILRYIESGAALPAAGAPQPARHPISGGEPHGPTAQPWPGDVVEAMSRIRQLTADHMTLARRTAAHVTSFFEIDLTRVARIRAKHRADFEAATGQKLTFLPFIIRAVVDGLKQFPVLNAAVSGASIIHRRQYNIGIAVALDWGLIVPVIKNADGLSITGLTRQLNDLAARARSKKLDPREIQDATFTITNPGVFGSLMGTPIIPVGTSAILGLGAIEKRPKVLPGPDGEDTIAVRSCAYFSISFDHRIVDGADADRFMAFVKKQLEAFPDTVL
ncbi:MAG: 2-oxo acid dehydrogenase subunit E2 [Gemmatimonadota bacterium]|nr:2-oxo acid dehydrogenase subunit E2 [Gemmatimonadota bacterium]